MNNPDKLLDTLYTNYFNQLLRARQSPSFVEKNVLDETVNILRQYILNFSKKIRENIQEYEKGKITSSLVWDPEFYKKVSKEKYDILDEFESKVKDIFSNKFLEKDFSKTNSIIDTIYPNILPKSSVRELYLDYWKSIQEQD